MAANHGSSGDGNSGGCGSGRQRGLDDGGGLGGYGGGNRLAAAGSMRRRFCIESRILGMFCDRDFCHSVSEAREARDE